ncbi:sphingosine-1-phosphate phosphatase 2 [Microcaecilia unicolor]|uniref:Sphingosine-1-phosphate phosphatase 2 n=1 Tax=Microcaecilia unicolor TaxID=1415580 RepID=A0A6P7ZBQ8_9AMPH|nr:sphingosine-1-phosphate phosphatase 2 [Microcaecilia unicolor]
MAALPRYLQQTHLVVRFQRCCGLYLSYDGGTEHQHRRASANGDAPVAGTWPSLAQQNGSGSQQKPTDRGPAPKYIVKNYILYYLFRFAAALGQEIFYITFLPFTYWNIDPYVARRLINVWVVVMYIGQASKDLLKWPRPSSPPVVKLETRVDTEYGMPSTHAMAATAISFTFLLAAMQRYKCPLEMGLMVAFFLSTLVSLSRIYTGMHTVLDVICGALAAALIITMTYPFWDIVDHLILTSPFCPLFFTVVPFLMSYNYPKLDHYSPTRADTTTILGVSAGTNIGAWLNYQCGRTYELIGSPPFITPPATIDLLVVMIVRFLLGMCVLIVTRQVIKRLSLELLCSWHKVSVKDTKARQSLEIEVPYKFVTYSGIGFSATVVVPLLCKSVGL